MKFEIKYFTRNEVQLLSGRCGNNWDWEAFYCKIQKKILTVWKGKF
jgi:hypothetical protein